jgi:hypothetical protein
MLGRDITQLIGHTGDCNLHIQGRCLNIKEQKQQVPPQS